MEKRTTFVSKQSLRNRSWRLEDEESSNLCFSGLSGLCYDIRGSRSVKWSATKSLKHLNTDYSTSAFLSRVGVLPRYPFTMVTVCEDGELICEFLILGTDGYCYDRAELSANSNLSAWNRAVDFVPTPREIENECQLIRQHKPISDYAEQWVGSDGSGMREISLTEVSDVGFD